MLKKLCGALLLSITVLCVICSCSAANNTAYKNVTMEQIHKGEIPVNTEIEVEGHLDKSNLKSGDIAYMYDQLFDCYVDVNNIDSEDLNNIGVYEITIVRGKIIQEPTEGFEDKYRIIADEVEESDKEGYKLRTK